MTTSKLLDGKRRSHAAKVLQKMSKKQETTETEEVASTSASASKTNEDRPEKALKEQYILIRDDILKLRDDLTKGYDMAKGLLEKKGVVKELIKGQINL
ncbi:MAG TPA: hypothetical protein VNJ01_13300 [Bacteriovoracaceae bacterium]|nr:hypothetical protein [Bacteriovoracaceae bacterium]